MIGPFFEGLTTEQLRSIGVVAIDMHDPFVNSAIWYVPNMESKLCFERSHIAQLLGNAVDVTRRAENKRLVQEEDDSLKGTKYIWLKNPKSMPRKLRRQFSALRDNSLLVAEVWAIKDAARGTRAWAGRGERGAGSATGQSPLRSLPPCGSRRRCGTTCSEL